MRTVSRRLADLCENTKIHLGRVGDNLHTQVRIDCLKLFEEYPNATAALTVRPPKGDSYPAVVVREGDFIIWNVTDSDLIYPGTGEAQMVFTEGDVVAHKAPFKTFVERSIQPSGQIPTPVQNWVEQANEVLEEVRDAIPEGGTTGQVLAKASNDDYDLEWVDPGSGGTSDYEELDNLPQIGGVTLTGDVSLHDLGAAAESDIPDVSGFYTKPSGGIPDTDLASGVQTSLGKADTAYQKPAGGIPAEDMASGVIPVLTDLIDDTAGAGDTDKVWSADKSAAEKSSLLTEITNGSAMTADAKSDIDQIAKDGYQKYFPEWEGGAWGLSGKEVNANSMRSKDLIYLPSGVYTVYSVDPLSVFTYYDTEAQDGGNPQWKQTGEHTITITTRNYVGLAVEWASTESGNPTGNYVIIPSAVSDVIATANKTADDLAETSARTVFSDGTFNAVLQNVTVTENKGIGSGILVGSVVSLTNDSYSQVMEVPVTAGRTYRMKARVYANYFIAHFTDNNNILIEKTGKNTTGATTTMVDFSAVAPAGATKLYIAGMKNTKILCDVFNPYTVKDIISMNENKARGAFCIMEFNVGDWYQGIYRDGDKTGIIPADETIYEQYMTLFRGIFNRYKPDIALLNEEAQNMCMNRHDDSRAFLGKWWRYQYRGLLQSQDLSDVFNTIASCLPLSDITVRNFTDTESNMHRNYIKGYLYLNGKKICVICAHLSSNLDIAKLNATELLNDLQTEDPEYLICCGDFNYDINIPEIAAFQTAGYTISRGNVVYDGHTYGPGDLVVTTPNITVKSCFCDEQKIGNVSYIDHLPTVTYLEIF